MHKFPREFGNFLKKVKENLEKNVQRTMYIQEGLETQCAN